MVRKLEPLLESEFEEAAKRLAALNSYPIGPSFSVASAGIFAAGYEQDGEKICYWIGDRNLVRAFIVLDALALPGLEGRQAVRGWRHADLKGTGAFHELMQTASEGRPLVSDRDGMTQASYLSWIRAPGFVISFYDQSVMAPVSADQVPEADRFLPGMPGNRYLMVLTPVPNSVSRDYRAHS